MWGSGPTRPTFLTMKKIMTKILNYLSSGDKMMRRDALKGVQAEQCLTLTDADPESDNRYFICLRGDAAEIDWQKGDALMVELALCAYKHGGQWHMATDQNSVELVEIDIIQNNI